MASEAVRQAIIDSLFSPDSGGAAEKLLIHLKVFEDVKQTDPSAKNSSRGPQIVGKPRYLCLTQKRNKIRLYKTKRNQNGAFTIGKTWSLDDIRQIESIDANQFSMTLNKTYIWAVERPRDKLVFMAHVVDACQRFLGKSPRLINLDESYLLRYLANPIAVPSTPTAPSPIVPASPTTATSMSTAPSPVPPSSASQSFQQPESDPRSYPSPPPNMSPDRPRNSPLSPPPTTLPVASRAAPSPPIVPATRSPQRPVEMSPPMNVQPEEPQPPPQRYQPPVDPREREREERRERERARQAQREREKRDKQAQQEKEKLRKAAEMQEKMAEKASLMNVEELLADFNWKTSGNAAALEKRLLGELHALEAANVHAIIQSDERVRSVIDQIDHALQELDSMDSWLLLYSAELNSMGDDIREIESQNRGLQVLAQNQHSLVRELDDLLNAITIPRSCLDSLKFDPMDTAENVDQIQRAAEKVQQVLKIKLGDGMQNMKAVQERMEVYNSHSNKFSARIFDFMKSQFDKQAENQRSVSGRPNTSRKQQPVVAMPHTVVEDNLIKYQGFSLWEKEMEPRMYSELQRYYAQTMAPLYEQDVRELIDSVRPLYTTLRNRGLDELEYIFKPEESRPVRALAYGANLRSEDSRTNRYRQMLRGSVEGVIGGGGAGIDGDERAADDAFAQLMAQGTMLVTREQNFMCDLFQYSQGAPKSFLERGPVYAQVPNTNELCGRREKPRDVKMSKKILDWMEIIFETLEPSIVSLLEYGVKSDPTQAVSMLASVEFQNDKWQGSDQDFLLRLCSSLTQRLTRMFERFVSDQLKIIEDTKVSTKKRRGILPFFRTFPLYALRLEVAAANIESDSQTRQTVNDAYEKIINAMMSSLDSIARETDQTGDDKEQLNANIMYIENMHHFHHELRSNKLHVLEKWMKYAKNHYDTSLNAYIKVVIRRPLGKLLEFFEGVDNLLHTSTPEEVQFHMNYNKTQLRKVIAMYPAKEIKKSLEQLYKRVDKHFSEEEGLLQVVWRGIQEELTQQHGKMETLIQRCYPDARVHLEFSIQDLLSVNS
ncbi:exocyst complex component Sec3-domain-containing protein [Fennellomyces sp. T-0311]|nr:exocyst complex component Sec3-domain-containing protein [Fennellomyces sp. T-0311]